MCDFGVEGLPLLVDQRPSRSYQAERRAFTLTATMGPVEAPSALFLTLSEQSDHVLLKSCCTESLSPQR